MEVSGQPGKNPKKRPVALGPLRFGIDVDGTISRAPRHFKRLIEALLERGNEAYIITGRTEDKRLETEELLSCLDIPYTELVMRPINWPGSVAEFKVWEVRNRGIHLMIDDDPEICWAIERETQALAAHMLPVPVMPEVRTARARLRKREAGKGRQKAA